MLLIQNNFFVLFNLYHLKKAEPFKVWLAEVGRVRIEESMDPELIAERLVATYERKSYTHEWINQRLRAISVC